MRSDGRQVQIRRRLDMMERRMAKLEKRLKLISMKGSESSLDRGLRELKEGKYHTYKSVTELDKAIRKRH